MSFFSRFRSKPNTAKNTKSTAEMLPPPFSKEILDEYLKYYQIKESLFYKKIKEKNNYTEKDDAQLNLASKKLKEIYKLYSSEIDKSIRTRNNLLGGSLSRKSTRRKTSKRMKRR